MNRVTTIILGVVVLVIVAGGFFYSGMLFGQGPPQSGALSANDFGPPGMGQGGYGPGPGQMPGVQGNGVLGQITEIGSGFLVVTDDNGNQTRVQVADTTLIEKNASVKLTDLAKGETVMVVGSQGTDGTITANSVQVAPAARLGGTDGVPNPQN